MRLKAEQLSNSLKQLSAVYLISGDEPLQQGELADRVRKAAKQSGFSNREVLRVDSHFDWQSLIHAGANNALFAEKTLLELRLTSNQIGTEGAKVLDHYCQHLPDNTLLLITAPKLNTSQLKSKWFKAVDKVAVVVQVWALDGTELMQWLRNRSLRRGMQIDQDAIEMLAARVEGNLLMAAQEIERLFILFGDKPITITEIDRVVSDNSRYDIFKLTDCLLLGQITRAFKILQNLQTEGIAGSSVLWVLARDLRLLMMIKIALNQGQPVGTVFKHYRLWGKQQRLVSHALSRLTETDLKQALIICAKADRQIKGYEQGDYWESVLRICFMLRLKK